MKTHVMGKKIKNTWELDDGKGKDGEYICKPEIYIKDKEVTWEEICSYDDVPQDCFYGNLYLSEDERVYIEKKKFRADLGEWFQYTDKIIEEKDINIKKVQKELKEEIRGFNKYRIEHDSRAKAYCDLHHLNYEETDYAELKKIIDPNLFGNTENEFLTLRDRIYSKSFWYNPHLNASNVEFRVSLNGEEL